MTTHYARPLWQRLTSALTALVMVLGMLPFTSQAAQTAPLAPSRADLLAESELAAAINAPQAPTAGDGPGGVSTNLALWLKADEGVTQSGGTVSAWADQSTTGTDAAQATAADQPTYVAEAMNFNPALDFDNTNLTNQYLSFDPSAMPAGTSDRTFIAVASQETTTADFRFVIGYGDNSGFLNQLTLLGAYYNKPTAWDGGAFHTPANLDWPDNTPAIASKAFTLNGANQEGYLYYNGEASEDNPDSRLTVSNVAQVRGAIGKHPYDSYHYPWNGYIAEVIVYSSALQGTTEMQKIESYLAIKYGITLDQTAPTDYLDSAGAIIWNATTNAAYNNDIAGLGRDDASGLNQLKSKSVNSSATVTMDTAGFATDQAFWVWGHDGDAANYTTTGAPIGLEMLERTWKAQRTNIAAADSVTICTSITADYLLLDADGVFSSGAISHTLTSGCASGIDATSGAFFTFARDNATTADIYNQDGIGFSGTIPPNPLSDNLMMSSYQDWPAGYNDGAFIGSVFDGENTWLVPYNANQVVKIAPDGTMTEYSNWPTGYTKGLAAFEGGVFDGQNIWLVPHVADQLIKIDKDTGVMTSYSDWPAGVNLWVRSFVGGVFDGTHIWLIPFSASHLVRVDPTDGSMVKYDWPTGYYKGFWAFRGGVFDGQNIWLIPYYSTHLIKFNTLDNTMTAYNNWPAGFIKTGAAFAGGVFDGDDLWMIPFYADRVVKFDTTTEQMTGYNDWPTGFFKTLGAFYGGGFDGQYIWMTPATANQVIRINKDDGAMTGYNVWPHDFYKLGRYFYGGGFDGQGLWLAPLIADRAIRLHKVPPAAPIVATPANGSVTDLDPLPFTGTAEPGATVAVSDDQGNVLCTAVADATTGAWSCTPAATGDGSYAFDVVAIDTEGNESDPTNVGVTVDSVNPPLAVTSPVSGTAINTDPPPFTGTTEAGAAITVTDSLDNVLCTATADGSGDWSCTPATALGESDHDVTVTADDGAGNTSAVPLSFEIDQTAPAAPDITEPLTGTTTSLMPTFAGTGEPGGALTLYDAGANPICTTTVAADGSWHCTPATPLTVGAQTLSATVTDAAGNEGDPAEVAIIASADTTAPAAPAVTAPVSGTTTGLTPTFAGTGETGAAINVYDANGDVICTTEVDSDGNWTCTPTEEQEEGDQSYSVTAADAVGNESFPPTEVSITVEAPASLAFCPGGVCTPALWLRADTDITATNAMTVTAWADLVGTNTFTVTGDPQVTADALNFNPVVAFDGDGDYLVGDTDITFVEAFAVTHAITDGGRLLAGDGAVPGGCGAYFFMRADVSSLFIGDADPDYAFTMNTPDPDGYRILNGALLGGTDASDSRIAVNGAAYITAGYGATDPLEPFTRAPLVGICGNRDANSQYTGNIAEVIVYENELSAADRLKVDSYLALKYGLTLSDTLDYVLSDGTTVVWDVTANAGYYHDVAAIVIDHGSALTQTQSRSINADSLITMGSPTDLSNSEALLWGNNDADATTYDQVAGSYQHVARIWRVQETGDVVSVTVTVADSNAAYILVSDSADFFSATAYPVGSSIDFADGQYFTLAQDAAEVTPPTVSRPISGTLINDATPTFTGTADAGAPITVTTHPTGTVLCAATADANGDWTCTPTTALPEGENTVAVVAGDGAGNESDPTYVDVPVDITAPIAPTVTAPISGDTVLTNTPTFEGAGEPGGEVNVYDGAGSVVCTATVDPDGDWSCTPDEALDEGEQTYAVTVTDEAGNESDPAEVTLTVDTTPPLPTDLSVVSDGPGVVGEATTFTATVSAGEPVTYTWDFGDGNTGDGSPISHPYQQAGDYTVIVTATNVTGAVSATLTVVIGDATVIIAPEAGDVLTHTNPDGSGTIVEIPAGTLTETLELVYTELDAPAAAPPTTTLRYAGRAFSLNLYRNGELVTGTVSFDPPITVTLIYTDSDVDLLDLETLEVYYWSVANQQWEQDGITHVEHDRANHRLILTIAHLTDFAMFAEPQDTTPPDAPVITAPISGTVTGQDALTVTGTADVTDTVGIIVTLYDADDNPVATCTADAFDPDTGAWSCDLDLSELDDGDYTIIAAATDASGNRSESDPVAFTLDTTPPAAPTVTAPEDGSTLMTDPPTFAGTAEPGATVEVRDDEGNVICEAVADENGDWLCTPDEPLGVGEHAIVVVAIDAAGNESDPAELTITIAASDNNPPVAVDDEWNVPESVPAQPASVLDVLANDSDPDGDAITITHVSEPTEGAVATDGATIVYTPTADFLGEVAFTYTISDGALTDTANVTLTVLPVADLAVEQHIRATLNGYDIIFVARNLGARDVVAPGAALSSTIPAEFGTITWECTASGGAECPTATGGGLTFSETLTTFPAHSVVTYTLTAQNSDNAIVWNTVTLTPPATMFDLDMSNNIHSRPSAYRLILPVIYKNADFSTP